MKCLKKLKPCLGYVGSIIFQKYRIAHVIRPSLLEYEINWWVDKNKSVGLKGFNEKKRVNGCFVKMEGEPTLMIVTEIKLTFHGKEIYLPTEFCASHVSSTQILRCNLLFDFQWMSPNTSSRCSTPKKRKP
jgi:hypothetical protein